MPWRRVGAAAFLLWACVAPSDGILIITLDTFDGVILTSGQLPDTTMSDSVLVEGLVVRSPPLRETRTTVTATGGDRTVSTTVLATGVFRITVPMHLNQVNSLEFTAEDATGAVATPLTLAVTHVP